MYVYTYIYICMYIYIYMYIHTYIYIYYLSIKSICVSYATNVYLSFLYVPPFQHHTTHSFAMFSLHSYPFISDHFLYRRRISAVYIMSTMTVQSVVKVTPLG